MRKNGISNVLKSSLLVLGILSVCSCASTDDGNYVAPITQYEKIGGNWILNSITQTDETTTSTMDLTNVFNFKSFGISFNLDSENNPTTFTITGSAPALLPTSGTWKLANAFVNSNGSSAKILLNNNVDLTITAVPGTNAVLEYKLTRKNNGVSFVSYTYNLTAQK
ncbi:MAG TPA: DUF5004 domain-containing protein [Xylanibacter oryzae]|uniref:DUF5004 domain-containing protein n=1 Tax=Xylanibacter oryzae TaxID=185293 RepID=UPI0004B5369B|nr:DUF5004 domain-containing protein [Xylanibacter oryzae]MBP7358314.1 DUF5004 domain-containing protein [Prevotella sp.]HRN16316.1 DUF5004 domain-containing protein [Xylanibacter oryzae]